MVQLRLRCPILEIRFTLIPSCFLCPPGNSIESHSSQTNKRHYGDEELFQASKHVECPWNACESDLWHDKPLSLSPFELTREEFTSHIGKSLQTMTNINILLLCNYHQIFFTSCKARNVLNCELSNLSESFCLSVDYRESRNVLY